MMVRAVSLEARLMTIRSAGSNFKSVVVMLLLAPRFPLCV